jgi:hypothetical protein
VNALPCAKLVMPREQVDTASDKERKRDANVLTRTVALRLCEAQQNSAHRHTSLHSDAAALESLDWRCHGLNLLACLSSLLDTTPPSASLLAVGRHQVQSEGEGGDIPS